MQIAHMMHAVADADDDGDVPGPHLHGHDRHAWRVQGHEDRLRRRRHGRASTTLWYDDVKAGKIPAQRSAEAVPSGDAQPVKA
jgi:formate dehydrogenase subunit gamma